jgi:ATP-dependent RNA helicase DeaD
VGQGEARLRERDRLKTERSQRFVPLARTLAENEDESALIAMLVDDYYQETLHAPPVMVREAAPQDDLQSESRGPRSPRPRRRSSSRRPRRG